MNTHGLRLQLLGIDTQQEYVIYMRRDCHVCRAEGFEAQTRVEVGLRDRRIIATLNVVHSELLAAGEASLSTSAWRALGAAPGDTVTVVHAPTLDSLSAMRSKIYGHRLDAQAFDAIVGDVAAGRYSDLDIAAFLSACAGGRHREGVLAFEVSAPRPSAIEFRIDRPGESAPRTFRWQL